MVRARSCWPLWLVADSVFWLVELRWVVAIDSLMELFVEAAWFAAVGLVWWVILLPEPAAPSDDGEQQNDA